MEQRKGKLSSHQESSDSFRGARRIVLEKWAGARS